MNITDMMRATCGKNRGGNEAETHDITLFILSFLVTINKHSSIFARFFFLFAYLEACEQNRNTPCLIYNTCVQHPIWAEPGALDESYLILKCVSACSSQLVVSIGNAALRATCKILTWNKADTEKHFVTENGWMNGWMAVCHTKMTRILM